MVQSATQQLQSPPPPPKQPDAAPTASKASPKPATQTGFSARDGFEAPRAKPVDLAPAAPPDPNDPTAGMTKDERDAYDKLSPTERPRYDALHREALKNWQVSPDDGSMLATPEKSVDQLRALLRSGQMGDFLEVDGALGGQAGDQAHTDLHQLVFRGVLPGARNIDGDTTLAALSHLADDQTKLMPNIDRRGLLGSLLHDLNHHEDIRQLDHSPNCSGGGAAWYMAANESPEYVREVSEMAQHGEVQLQPEIMDKLRALGLPIPESGTRTFQGTFKPEENPTAQLFGGGFTDAAQDEGNQGFIQRIFDTIQQVFGVDEGVTGTQYKDELNETWGGPKWDVYFLPPQGDPNVSQDVKDHARSTTAEMLAGASATNPVMVNIDGHFVGVTHYDPETGALRYFDPNAELDQPLPPLTFDDVMAKSTSVVYQADQAHPEVSPDLTSHPEWDREGGGGPGTGGFGGGGGGSSGTTRTGG